MPSPTNETLSNVPLFSGLEPRDLDRIADSFKQRNYAAGDKIANEGSGGAGFFVIGEGTAKVTVHGEERATLGPGDYFGEIALIDEGTRSATITAATPRDPNPTLRQGGAARCSPRAGRAPRSVPPRSRAG